MAKIAFGKLGLTKNTSTVIVNYKESAIEVKQYLSVNDKLALISNVINYSADDNNFANPLKVSVYSVLEIIEAYTNLTFTDKQKEDPCKLYDLFVGNGLSTMILSAIPAAELAELLTGIEESIVAVYKYRNSALGILDIMQNDYDGLKFDINELQKAMNDPNGLTLLKNVVTKLG
jgi:hypothetical protein